MTTDAFKARSSFSLADGTQARYYRLAALEEQGLVPRLAALPFSIRVLLEAALRKHDGFLVTDDDVKTLCAWTPTAPAREFPFMPARVVLQDFTGVPCVVDLAALRDAMVGLGGDPNKVNPLVPVDLVIDHSVQVDFSGRFADARERNLEIEYARNDERYAFLKWGQLSLSNFRAVPPGRGIVHQVNLEWIATCAMRGDEGGVPVYFPDTVVGTDSHTTMINGLGVLGWGVGGIEAEAAMLGQPVSMLIPEVVGFKLTGKLPEGITATDLVLTVTQMLRKKGVVGRFVEFYGPGLDALSLADRATIANMAPEYGATCGFFPIDAETIRYMKFTGREDWRCEMVEAYAKAQGMWRDASTPDPVFTDTLGLDLSEVRPSLAGPRRPQDRVLLEDLSAGFEAELANSFKVGNAAKRVPVEGANYDIGHGDVVIAAITSCTNTSNPDVLVAAGLVAKKARAKGLDRKPWVKTSLAPGSQVVTDYLEKAGLQADLDAIGFDLVGYGCTTCIGNSGPLPAPISKAVNDGDIVAASVLSGNRNFEGRVSPDVRANYLASPPLVVAYALAGTVRKNLAKEPIGTGSDGAPVYLKDIWPTNHEVRSTVEASLDADMFKARYAHVFKGDAQWQAIDVTGGRTYSFSSVSTYVQNPPYFEGLSMTPKPLVDIVNARALAVFGDSITTDHISPAGSIKADSPAGTYLTEHQVSRADFNSYGSRRGNHEVMMRGTFANIRIKNKMLPGVEGGVTKHIPSGEQLAIYDAAMRYKDEGTPLVVLAGKEYGTGSSRDWAAKGTTLLGVRAVVAESYERIHRSNLVGMGVLPLQFQGNDSAESLGLTGDELFSIDGVASLKPRQNVTVNFTRADGSTGSFVARCRIDTNNELEYFRNGGILHYVLRNLAA